MPSSKGPAWKSFILGCLNAKQYPSSDQNLVSKKTPSRRVFLSDLSHSSSLSIMSDLSNSLIGSNIHIFTYQELKEVTHSFSKTNFLGEGGFGKVYKGFIDDQLRPRLVEPQVVAVKALDLDGKQGHREWLAEVIFLGQLKHRHLVNLIGYCCEDEHRLLVYEYMERGNLEEKLFKGLATLPWLTRIKIAIGAAKGLAFLHEEEKPVIYRDVKASNILLDADYNAKLSDFGLAIDGPGENQTHVTTRVMGTRGYAAPEYIMTGHLTTMSDVYSFGVVLLELLTGRKSVDKKRPAREQDLVEWARPMLRDPLKLERVMDPRLEGQYSPQGARKVAALAYHCLSHQAKGRPSMRAVVKALEPLMLLTDIPVGHFVYVAPSEDPGANNVEVSPEAEEKGGENDDRDRGDHEAKESSGNKAQGAKAGRKEKRKSRSRRSRVKPMRSRAVYSDTALYKTLGTSLYYPKQAPETGHGDGHGPVILAI